ncbi:YD repeat-containing protein [Microbulbifer donghaiensis]|uniref:YD repeat-containing protein n=1 Tax=Microbulbifer donghaiensis TaxID=494016 RepID=A0A1M5EGD1_9GAMM|nr:YD repeat-containing protein [Microbulbifer donghaiensis]
MPGPLPFAWQRYYRSSITENNGLGPGWRHTLSEKLTITEGHPDSDGAHAAVAELQTAEGRIVSFNVPPIGQSSYNRFERLLLHRQSLHSYRLRSFSQPDKIFRADGISGALPLTEIRDQFGNSLTVDYEGGLPRKVVSSWGRMLIFEYQNHCIKRILNRHAPTGEQSLCSYDYCTTAARLAAACSGTTHESYHYDSDRLTGVEHNLHGALEFSYDHQQRCHRLRKNRFEYSLCWQNSQRHCTLTVPDRHKTQWEFDGLGQLLRETQQGRVTSYFYDYYGNLCQKTSNAQREICRHDEFGRLVRRTRRGISDRFVYDDFGLLAAAHLRGKENWLFDYSDQRLPETVTDPAGHDWNLLFNERGQLIRLIDPENGKLKLHWDGQGQLTSILRGERHWRFEYDNWNRLTGSSCGNLTARQWRYQSSGELLEYRCGERILKVESDTRGRPCGISENGRVRLLWERDDDGDICRLRLPTGDTWEIRYDKYKNVVQAQNSANTLTWRYDRFGQLCAFDDARGDCIQWRYDSSARVREYRNNDTRWFFTYDDCGALRQIRNNSGQQCEFHHDECGRLLLADNGYSRVRFQYDRRGRLIAEHHDSSDSESLDINHQYDRRGWLKKSTSGELDISYLLAPDAALYGIDANGEAVLRCEYLDAEENWTQGRIHSRHRYLDGQLASIETTHNQRWHFASRESGRDIEPALSADHSGIERDQHGSIARERRSDSSDSEYRYQYDGWGLMTGAECDAFKTYFRYDPFGRRLRKLTTYRKSTQQKRVLYYWNSLGLWAEHSQIAAIEEPPSQYLYHPLTGALLSCWQAGALKHYLLDPAGRPLVQFDHQGELLSPESAAPAQVGTNGEPGPGSCRLRGTAQMLDPETGLYYSWQGYWNPIRHCWLHREDPFGGNQQGTVSEFEYTAEVDVEPA